MPETFINTDKAADLIGVSHRHARRFLEDHGVKEIRIGRKVYWLTRDVLKVLKKESKRLP